MSATIVDCWIEPGSSDNGNILWISNGAGRDKIVGGFPSIEEAVAIARKDYGWEPTINTL